MPKFYMKSKNSLLEKDVSLERWKAHQRYNDYSFRWNTRQINDGERITEAIKGADGKRLMYRQPISKSA